MDKFFTRYKLLVLLLIALAVRLVWFAFTDNYIDGDAPERLRVAYDWARHPVWFPNPDWLPGHYYLTGGLIWLTGDTIYAPRLLMLALSVLSIIPLYLFVKQKFDEQTAFYSGLAFALLHTQVLVSSLTLSEVPLLFFMLWGLYFLQRAITTANIYAITAGALCFAAANLFRYEGWIFTAMAGVWFLLRSRQAAGFVVFAMLSFGTAFWVMANSYWLTGHALYGIWVTDTEVTNTMAYDGLTLPTLLSAVWFGFPPLMLLALVPALQYIKTSRHRYYLLLALVPVLIALYKILTHTLMPNTRYFVMYSALLLPLAVQGYLHWYGPRQRRISKAAFMLLIITLPELLVGGLYTYAMGTFQHNLKYPHGFFESARYVKDVIPEARLMVDYRIDAGARAWMTYANQPLLSLRQCSSNGVAYKLGEERFREPVLNDSVLCTRIHNRDITHVVVFDSEELTDYLPLEEDTELCNDLLFIREFQEEEFSVYKVVDTDTVPTEVIENVE